MNYQQNLCTPTSLSASSKNDYWQASTLYILLKTISVAAFILIFQYLLHKNYFYTYPDFLHSYSTCSIHSPNGFFTMFNCLFNIKEISQPAAILPAILIGAARDLGFLWIAYKEMNRKGLYLFVILLACHPYLTLYFGKWETSCIASFGVMLICLYTYLDKKTDYTFYFLSLIISGFRNGIAPLFIIFYLVELFNSVKTKNWLNCLKVLLLIMAIVYIIELPTTYLSSFMSSSYPLSYTHITTWLTHQIGFMGHILAFPVLIISHLILLLGFREAAFTDFPTLFTTLSLSNLSQLIASSLLVVIHGYGLYAFFRYFGKRDKRYTILLLCVVPSFLVVAHLRYLIPLIPLALFGLAKAVSTRKVTHSNPDTEQLVSHTK